MAMYFNRTRSPLPVALAGGRSVLVPPKSKIEIPDDCKSEGFYDVVSKGLLVALRQPKAESKPDSVVSVAVPEDDHVVAAAISPPSPIEPKVPEVFVVVPFHTEEDLQEDASNSTTVDIADRQ